jgi:4-hydroxythreonine-4-phosphate dehydrogenase
MKKPVVAVTFGDACGIGPELIAKLLARPDAQDAATMVVVGDPWVWAEGQRVAGTTTSLKPISGWKEARGGEGPFFLAVETVARNDVIAGQMTPAAGRGARAALTICLDAVQRGDSDAICFAPLNKQAMKLGGMRHFEDELHHFADYFGVTGLLLRVQHPGQFVDLAHLVSHVPLKPTWSQIPVTKERIQAGGAN